MNAHAKYASLLVLIVLTAGTMACGGGAEPAAAATPVSQTELLHSIDAGDAPMILDVRSPEEFAEGHVPGAVNIEYDELAERLAEIEAVRHAPVVVYCRSGRRAGIAEAVLLEQGFSNVQHLEGDMLAWLEAGLPVEK